MIDIHAHILPGLDDGPPDMAAALEMAHAAAFYGVSAIVATPHYIPGVYENDGETIIRAVDKLNNCLQKERIPLTVIPGVEAYIDIGLSSAVKHGRVLTINNGGKYLLVEFPTTGIPDYTEQVIFELMVSGVTPIIAHPERNKAVLKNPQLLCDLLNKGALVQITAASLKGVWGREIKELAIEFLKLGWVHFVGTDAHSSSGRRSQPLAGVVPILERIVGTKTSRLLILENPQKVLEGLPIVVSNYEKYVLYNGNLWKRIFSVFK